MRAFYLRLIEQGPDSPATWLVLAVLYPFSLLYGLIVVLRRKLYARGILSSYRAGVPVVSVGNLTVGGTGKTPVVDALVKHLLGRGCRVAVVSRGYRGTFAGSWARVSGAGGTGTIASAVEAGDEPFLLAVRNPEALVYVARRRRQGVAAAIADGAACIVLDDAFQHWAVARDLDLVLLDGRAPFGNGRLLPAGNLREPVAALQRADLVLATHAPAAPGPATVPATAVRCHHRFADHLVDLRGRRHEWADVLERPCLAFAGIARPDDFFHRLREAGCQLIDTWALADHQVYDGPVIDRLNRAGQQADVLLTTEKDAVKLSADALRKPCLAVPLQLVFDDFAPIAAALDRLCGDRHA